MMIIKSHQRATPDVLGFRVVIRLSRWEARQHGPPREAALERERADEMRGRLGHQHAQLPPPA